MKYLKILNKLSYNRTVESIKDLLEEIMKKFNTAGMLAVLMLCLTACYGLGTDAGETDIEFPDT